MTELQFTDKFVGFVDILGFKNLVRNAELGRGLSLSELFQAQSALGNENDKKKFEEYGAEVCPHSRCIKPNLDFQLTQVSDCVIVSTEISPAGGINIVGHCWRACISLLVKGIMCRGYITRGPIYHSGDKLIGSGYVEAYEREREVSFFKQDANERGTPFVEVDRSVTDYIEAESDECVREMCSRMVTVDGGIAAIFPFKRLSHSFIVAGHGHMFDAAREKEAVNILRQNIRGYKEKVVSLVDATNESAMRKCNHYLMALDKQLSDCDQTDRVIDQLSEPYPTATRSIF